MDDINLETYDFVRKILYFDAKLNITFYYDSLI